MYITNWEITSWFYGFYEWGIEYHPQLIPTIIYDYTTANTHLLWVTHNAKHIRHNVTNFDNHTSMWRFIACVNHR